MSSDSGIRKRNKDKKKKKGSAGDVNVPVSTAFREAPSMRLVIDETIHVPSDRNFGGNCCSKLIFVAFLIALAGLMFFLVSNWNFIQVGDQHESVKREEDLSNTFDSWFAKLVNLEYFASTNEPLEKVDNEEPPADEQLQSSYLDILWELYPFGGHEDTTQEPLPEEALDAPSEPESRKDSREIDTSKEVDPEEDEENDTNQEEDESDKESEENDNNDEKDDVSPVDDFDDAPKPFNPYSHRYDRGEKESKEESEEDETQIPDEDENDSSNKSDEEPEVDRRDSRYNYYHSRDRAFEEEKYKYIRDDDDVNDSAEKGAHERFDSEENKDAPGNEEENEPEPDSHSSEEVEHDNKLTSEESEEDKEPKVEESDNQPESGNINRVPQEAEAVLNNGGRGQDDENAETIAQTVYENVMDLLNDDVNDLNDRLEKNKTLQEYLETPSASENEQSEDDSLNWQNRGNAPLDLEESETASETGDETENSESGLNTTSRYAGNYDRANVTNQYDWRHREEIDDADDDLDHGDFQL